MLQPMTAYWCAFTAMSNTVASEIIKQKPQLQAGVCGWTADLNNLFSASFKIAGNANNVTTPEKAIIAQRKIPTVL